MHGDGSNIVRVRLKTGNLFGGIVVVDPQLKVVTATYNPVLSCDESAGSDRDVGQLERLDDLLRLVGPDVDMAAVECGEDPRLFRVEVDAFDSLASRE
jgi:hypothetical protein